MSEVLSERLQSGVAPRQMSAWQRWEMTSITSAPAVAEGPAAAGMDAACPTEPASLACASPVVMDEDELTRIRLQAQQAGQAEGQKQGFAQGHAEGYAAGLAKAQTQAQAMQALLLALPQAMHTAEAEVAEDLLALAIDIAQQVVNQTLVADPEPMLALVRNLLRMEPVLNGTPRLLLHADDVALVQQHLGEELTMAGWRIRTDLTIQRGGCRVHAASGALDATLETRWERVTAAFQHKPDKPKKTPKPKRTKEAGHV